MKAAELIKRLQMVNGNTIVTTWDAYLDKESTEVVLNKMKATEYDKPERILIMDIKLSREQL